MAGIEQEQDFSRYELERSEDGSAFNRIYTAMAQGRSSYSYIDTKPLFEGYYRLKMIDIDGASKYSSVVFIRQSQVRSDFSVLGNPFSNTLVVKFRIPGDGRIALQLHDISGALVRRDEFNATGGSGIYTIYGFDRLSAGTYILKINYGVENHSIKVQKK